METSSSIIIPADEAARIAAVRRYEILDSPRDGAFDRVTELAARLFKVPISIVSIVDEDRIWFKSRHGIDLEQVGRDPGLCASAILQDASLVVADASVDPRLLANPLVAGEFGLRFYAGAPLRTSDGHSLGTVCVIDKEPREFSDGDVATLEQLAAIVVHELELRLVTRTVVESERQTRALEAARRGLEAAEHERGGRGSFTMRRCRASELARRCDSSSPSTPRTPAPPVRTPPARDVERTRRAPTARLPRACPEDVPGGSRRSVR